MSAPGRYRRPDSTVKLNNWYGPDRRSKDPLQMLARSLYDVCRSAADPYELAAHLEAIGFNRHRVKNEFGLAGPFELAEALFKLTPRKPKLALGSQAKISFMWLRQITILASILVTVGLQAKAPAVNWAVVVFLIAWSVIGSRFIDRAPAELKPRQAKAVLTVAIGIGLLGLIALWMLSFPALADAIVGALWWGITGSLWVENLTGRKAYWSLLPVVVAALGLLPVPFPLLLILLLLLAVSLVLFAPFLALPDAAVWRYFGLRPDITALLAAYGLGLGILFVDLFRSYPDQLILGSVILVIMLFTTEWLLIWFKRVMSDSLWRAHTNEEFTQRAWTGGAGLLRVLVIAALVIMLIVLQLSWAVTGSVISQFGLFGLSLGLALILFTLDNLFIPCVLLGLAAVTVLAGVPFGLMIIGLSLAMAVGVFIHLRDVEAYGVRLL